MCTHGFVGAILSAFVQQMLIELLLNTSPLISSFSQEISNINSDGKNNVGWYK